MTGNDNAAKWIAKKLIEDSRFIEVNLIGSGFLKITTDEQTTFKAVALGVNSVVTKDDVVYLFDIEENFPEFVVNVPSRTIWSGAAIEFVHNSGSAFGTVGDLMSASFPGPVSTYRNKEFEFFEQAFRQHTAVREVTRVYDKVFQLHRHRGMPDLTIVLVEAYAVSAENIRHARSRYGKFDVALKTTNYGSITTAADAAAESMGAEVFQLRDLFVRLNNQ